MTSHRSWSSDNVFISGAEGLWFKSWAVKADIGLPAARRGCNILKETLLPWQSRQ